MAAIWQTVKSLSTNLFGWPPGVASDGRKPLHLPPSVEKIKASVPMPAFLPYFDERQNVDETEEHRTAYRRMLNDPNVKAAIFGKIFGVLSLTLNIYPANKSNARDREIAQFIDWNLNRRCVGGVPDLVWCIFMHAAICGVSVSEKVWGKPEKSGPWKGKRPLRMLKAKDVDQDCVLEIDAYKNIIGVRGLRYNAGEVFDARDFVIYKNTPLFDNPGGMSDFRAVYARWWLSETALILRGHGAQNSAYPLLVGEYDDDVKQKQLTDALGQANALKWMATPRDARIQAVNLAGESSQFFKDLRKDLQEEIFLGLSGAILQAITGAPGQMRGHSVVHSATADVWKQVLATKFVVLMNDLERGLIKDIVDLNYQDVQEYPWATLGKVDDNDLAGAMQIDQGLVSIGCELDEEELSERYGRTLKYNPALSLVKLGGSLGTGTGIGRPVGSTGESAGDSEQPSGKIAADDGSAGAPPAPQH